MFQWLIKNKSCDVGEYLDYKKNWKSRKKLADKLIERSYTEQSSTEECTENIDEVKIADENECVYSYTICVVLIVIALAIGIGIIAYFAYSRWYLRKDISCVKLVPRRNGIAFKHQFNDLINEKSQTNRDQKLNLLFW